MARVRRARSQEQQARREPEPQAERSASEPERPLPDSLHPSSEIDQWIDALLQFAPLPQVERGLSVPALEPAIAARLRAMLRARHLAAGDFEAAWRFVDPAPAAEEPEPQVASLRFQKGGRYPEPLDADWEASARTIQDLAQKAAAPAAPLERATACDALAAKWDEVRGRLIMLSLEDAFVFRSEFYSGWQQRHRNAQLAGLAAGNAAPELENRDELLHAQRLWLRAADLAAGTPLAARSLARANDALRRMAELSPWSLARAFETDASARSRELHARLLREHPASDEARQSVWWSFPPPAELEWLPEDWQPYNVEVAIADAFSGRRGHPSESPQWADFRAFEKQLAEVRAAASERDPPALLEEVRKLRREFLPHFTSARGAHILNELDDLELFLSSPGVTRAVCAKYLAARGAQEPPRLDDPELQSWLDFLTFLALVREPGGRPMAERMREFLENFPHSRKREAALTRLAIATVREMRSVHVVSTKWPDAPKLGGYKALAVKRRQPFDAARAFAALDACEREFPNGRYAADLRLWRGAAAAEAGDWRRAVDLLVATLDDQSKRDLHLDAALHLAEVFMRLLEAPAARPAITAAIKTNPSAQNRLRQFMHSETMGARLRFLEGWLAEQFAK